MTDGLHCECSIPLDWRAFSPPPAERDAMLREATLLLTAINQVEGGHEPDASGTDNRRLERLEAKLDLALYLLARNLEADAPSAARLVDLSAEGMSWRDAAPPAEGADLVLALRPSDALPLTLRLPARALPAEGDRAAARFADLPDALADALVQFVFRRHRQAIRARVG